VLDIDAYFARIGYSGSRAATLETLQALHWHHPLAIPFETIDPLLGRPVRLEVPALERKLVADQRGGYCFEQNLLFGNVLAALGFRVANLAARVIWERGEDNRARTHMLLLLDLGAGVHLCDVGFGGLTMTAPVRLEPDVEQPTPHETFRVLRDGREFVLEARLRGAWKALYRFDLQEQRPVDIDVLNYYVSTHRDSPFLSRLMAARPTADRRFALTNGRFTVYHASGAEERRDLTSVGELRGVLTGTFGIALPEDARLDGALARVLE
jgi:N-hydroxyarylamine O-acetyltransferase